MKSNHQKGNIFEGPSGGAARYAGLMGVPDPPVGFPVRREFDWVAAVQLWRREKAPTRPSGRGSGRYEVAEPLRLVTRCS